MDKFKYFHEIVGKSSTLVERITNPNLLPNTTDQTLIHKRLQELMLALDPHSSKEILEHYLSWSKLDKEDILRALQDMYWNDTSPLPVWTNIFQQALAYSASVSLKKYSNTISQLSDDSSCIPFFEILMPFVEVYKLMLNSLAGSAKRFWSSNALFSLEHAIIATLSRYAAKSLYSEFNLFRYKRQTTLDILLSAPKDKKNYNDFVQKMLDGGLWRFFEKYPVLARILSQLTRFYIDAHSELILRLSADYRAISETFSKGNYLENVNHIETDLSDPHNQHRTVSILTFGTGVKIVYKPKNLEIESAYNSFLEWLKNNQCPINLHSLKVLNRNTYGWVEYVEPDIANTNPKNEQYFFNAGAILCIVNMLGGTDCHFENLIYSGNDPFLLDDETLLHPHIKPIDDFPPISSANYKALQVLENSVLHTHFLPQWRLMGSTNEIIDISALAGRDWVNKTKSFFTWFAPNSDAMRPGPNLSNNIGVETSDHTEFDIDSIKAINNGFEKMYWFLISSKDNLTLFNGIQLFADKFNRFVFRNSDVYSLLTKEIQQPSRLIDGLAFSIPFERLARVFLICDEPPRLWPLLEYERSSLENLDIPIFTAQSTSNSLQVGSITILKDCFTETSYNRVIYRILNLCEKDLDFQKRIIIETIHAYQSSHLDLITHDISKERNTEQDSNTILLDAAVRISEIINLAAIHGDNDSITWIAPQGLLNSERFQLSHLGYSLYDGIIGIAIFYAAIACITHNDNQRNIVYQILENFVGLIEIAKKRNFYKLSFQRMGIGGASGLGSLIYGLTCVSRLLNDSQLVSNIVFISQIISQDLISQDQTFDVINGAAGAILSLLAGFQITKDDTLLAKAIICGNHLVKTQKSTPNGELSWQTLDGKFLLGFSHGAAGIAYSLLKLYKETRDQKYYEAAISAITYEQSMYEKSEMNWPDLRINNKTNRYKISWCHGATGIGLARLATIDIVNSDKITQDIAIAIQRTQKSLLSAHNQTDQLCCGNFGRIELLLLASLKLNPKIYTDIINNSAKKIVQQAGINADYNLQIRIKNGFVWPSLFQGISGIGYELLRINYPSVLPSLLLWE